MYGSLQAGWVLAGFLKCKVSTVADVEMLLLGNRTYCAEIAHNVSAKKRTDIITRARQVCIQSAFSIKRKMCSMR